MATKDRTALKDEFKNGNLATGERFADLIDSMKTVQEPVTDPAASGTSLSFIDSISQDADGKITATKKTLDLANAHELNPFKGWYKTGDTLPTDGFDGAYLYFKDTTQTPAVTTIYRWNGTAYADTGTVVDTSNVQTFGTGQAVNMTRIIEGAVNDYGDSVVGGELFEGSNVYELALSPYGLSVGSTLKEDGTYGTAATPGGKVETFDVKNAKFVKVSGWSASQSSGNALACFYDESMGFLSYVHDVYNQAVVDKVLVVASGARYVKVYGNANQRPAVKGVYFNTLDNKKLSQYAYKSILEQAISRSLIDGRVGATELLKLRELDADVYIPNEIKDQGPNSMWKGASSGMYMITSANEFVHACKVEIPVGYDNVVFVGGELTSNSSMQCYGFLDSDGLEISHYSPVVDPTLSEHRLMVYDVAIPEGAKYFCTNCQALGTPPLLNKSNFWVYFKKATSSLSEYVDNAIKSYGENVKPSAVYPGKGVKATGELFDAISPGAVVNEYSLGEGRYCVSGVSPSDNNANNAVAFVVLDASDNVVLHCKPTKPVFSDGVLVGGGFVDYILNVPAGAAKLLVFGRPVQKPLLKRYTNTFEHIKIESIPQICNNVDYTPLKNNKIKVLCLGSSWFMDTWWYLNKLMGASGVDCELHCYYIGHSSMNEWVQLYNNDLTPFLGLEVNRSAQKCISVNGANWNINQYSSSGSYNAQAYRNDFYNDMVSGDWDIIAFQQGAQQAVIASEWEAAKPLLEIIKQNCSPRTKIAFNATYCFAEGYSGAYFQSYSRLADGKEYFQQVNNYNTRLFMAESGIYKVSPNGAMMSLMRADSSLNTGTDDMAADGLHPNNGLPILGLCGCFYETFLAPLTGVSFVDLNWLPDTSTQKAVVSGSSWQECSAEQLATLKLYVRKALGNRFVYYK